MDLREDIISFIRMRGPSLPVEVSKQIKKDLLITSAMLADLTSSKRLVISNIKVGQSKLYYVPGHENRLQNFSQHLNEKDRQTYEELRKSLVIRDRTASPLTRVSLRQLKDFAKPLDVHHEGDTEIFWKWYLLGNDEAGKKIKEILGIRDQEPPKIEKVQDAKEDTLELPSEKDRYKTDKEEKAIPISQKKPEGAIPPRQASLGDKIDDKKAATPLKKAERAERIQETKKDPGQRILESEIDDPFGKIVKSHFDRKGIKVKSFKIIKKKSEIDFDITIPSPAGELPYYCKAKSKKKVSEGDIATAILSGQMNKLPVLFVTDGEVNRKTQEKLMKEYSSITIMRI